MGRKRKSESAVAVAGSGEKRRKKITVDRIEREHAGKVREPYRILERLVEEEFPDLVEARFVLVWKKGWRRDRDEKLIWSKVKLASELEKEIAAEFDFVVLLNYELWNEVKIDEAAKELTIYHELCHCRPVLDEGEQKRDERGRLCWRLRKHSIEEFPETLKKYGLKRVTGLNALALDAMDDAQRPLLAAAEKASASDRPRMEAFKKPLAEAGILGRLAERLEEKGYDSLGKLQELLQRYPEGWHKQVPGLGPARAAKIGELFSTWLNQQG